jgi:hypothetical protein
LRKYADRLSVDGQMREGRWRGTGWIGAAIASLTLCAFLATAVGTPTAGATVPAATDVLLIFDTTGSMSGALAPAQAEIEATLQQIDSDLPNVRYGVAEVRDYAAVYGEPGDSPWQLDQPITDDRTAIQDAVNALQAGGGGTAPESYARALWEANTSGAIGWRPTAKHVVLLVGDSYPHDEDLDEGIPGSDQIVGSPWDTGHDPGPDEVVGTSDDINWQSVLARMGADDMPLMFLFYHGTAALSPYWRAWSKITGGLMESAGSGQLAADIVYLVERGAGLPPCLDGDVNPPCAVAPPDQTRTWNGSRKQILLDHIGGPRVPFQLLVKGGLAAGGDLLKPTTAKLSADPDRTLEIAGPGVAAATYGLSTGRFDTAEGVTLSSPSLVLTGTWPASVADRSASIPLFTLTSHADYQRSFARLHLDTSIEGSLSTSVGAMADWAAAHRWLGRAGRTSALAWWLTKHGNRLPSAYGKPLEFDALKAPLSDVVAQASRLARALRIHVHAAPAPTLRASLGSRSRQLRHTMSHWRSQAPAQSAPAGVEPAGLRMPLVLRSADRKGLRHGSWRNPGALTRRASAALLGVPVAARLQPLWLSAKRVRAGGALTVLAGGLRGLHEVGVTVVGRGYSAEAGLKPRRGAEAGSLVLPKALAPGRYWVGVLDFSRLDRPGGFARIAAARISVVR